MLKIFASYYSMLWREKLLNIQDKDNISCQVYKWEILIYIGFILLQEVIKNLGQQKQSVEHVVYRDCTLGTEPERTFLTVWLLVSLTKSAHCGGGNGQTGPVACAFAVISKKMLPNPMTWSFSPPCFIPAVLVLALILSLTEVEKSCNLLSASWKIRKSRDINHF